MDKFVSHSKALIQITYAVLMPAQYGALAQSCESDTFFETAKHFAVGDAPVSVAFGDFNNDGSADIVVAHQNSADESALLV